VRIAVPGTFCLVVGQSFVPGMADAQVHRPGIVVGQIGCRP
jgi:hypothetical protein